MAGWLSLLTGVITAVMLVCNGKLSAVTGMQSATVVIHVVGILVISAILLLRRERPFAARQPWYLYAGGTIGVLTTLMNNLAFGKISLSAIVALGLLGQSLMGILVDQFGLLGMERHPFRLHKLWGLLLVAAGIVVMMTDFQLLPVLFAFLPGVLLVVSRSLNARLGARTSVTISTWFNYVVGLTLSLVVWLLLGKTEPLATGSMAFSADPTIYLGGALGVCVVLLSNATVTKIPALYVTLFQFVGQVFGGVALDALLDGAFTKENLLGGTLVAAGLCVNLLLERRAARENESC